MAEQRDESPATPRRAPWASSADGPRRSQASGCTGQKAQVPGSPYTARDALGPVVGIVSEVLGSHGPYRWDPRAYWLP